MAPEAELMADELEPLPVSFGVHSLATLARESKRLCSFWQEGRIFEFDEDPRPYKRPKRPPSCSPSWERVQAVRDSPPETRTMRQLLRTVAGLTDEKIDEMLGPRLSVVR